MNTKWGWWSFGLLLVIVVVSGLFSNVYYDLIGVIVTIISFLLSITFGIISIIKRDTESKISFILGQISLILSILVLATMLAFTSDPLAMVFNRVFNR